MNWNMSKRGKKNVCSIRILGHGQIRHFENFMIQKMLHIRSLLGTICVLSIFIHKVVYLWTMQYYSIKHKYDEWRNLKKFGTWILKQIEYSEHHCVFLSLSLSTYYDFKKHTLFKSSERESKDVRKFTRNVYGGGGFHV